MSPFDTQVYHEHQICLRFHRILNVILEMAFSSHCTPIWKLNRICTTIINKVTRKCIWCCHRAQRCVTSPGFGVKLCSGAWKRGPDSHVGTFSYVCSTRVRSVKNTRWPERIDHHLVDIILKCMFWNKSIWISKFHWGMSLGSNIRIGSAHRFSQKWQLRVCKWNFRVCKMPLLMKISMKMKELGWF